MKALILAAGYATRLYPLTKDQPKPLIKVGDKTIVEHILAKIEKIDEIDAGLVKLLEERFMVVDKVKKVKIGGDLLIEDLQRENEIVDSLRTNLPKQFIKDLFDVIFTHSKKWQK